MNRILFSVKIHDIQTWVVNRESRISATKILREINFCYCEADYSANSVSTAMKAVISGFSQNAALEVLAFLTNFCASRLIKLWKRCATFLVTQRTVWAEKLRQIKQKVAVLINSSDYFITMLFTNSDVLPDDFAKHSDARLFAPSLARLLRDCETNFSNKIVKIYLRL